MSVQLEYIDFAFHVTRMEKKGSYLHPVTGENIDDPPPGWSSLKKENERICENYEAFLYRVKITTEEKFIKGVWFTLNLFKKKPLTISPYPTGGVVDQHYHRIGVPLELLVFRKDGTANRRRVGLQDDDALLYLVDTWTNDKKCGNKTEQIVIIAVLKDSEEDRLIQKEPVEGERPQLLDKRNNNYFQLVGSSWQTIQLPGESVNQYVKLFFASDIILPSWDTVIKTTGN